MKYVTQQFRFPVFKTTEFKRFHKNKMINHDIFQIPVNVYLELIQIDLVMLIKKHEKMNKQPNLGILHLNVGFYILKYKSESISFCQHMVMDTYP